MFPQKLLHGVFPAINQWFGVAQEALRPKLEVVLKREFAGRTFRLVPCTEAQSVISTTGMGAEEWLVLDEIASFDGLERLIVLGVGLDAPIAGGAMGQRSIFYRAITRAQMQVVIVDEFCEGGWLGPYFSTRTLALASNKQTIICVEEA